MARLKFFVFLVACVAVAFAGLMNLSGTSASQARVESLERLGWSQQLFETSGKLAQSLRTSALTAAAADPGLLQAAAGFKDAAPGEAAVAAARLAVEPAFAKLPDAIRNASVLLIGTQHGVTVAPVAGGAPELKEKDAFALAQAAESGPVGTHALVDGKLFRVAAAPILAGGQSVGILGAAFPLDEVFVARHAKELTVGLTVVAGDLVLSSLSGEQRAAAAKASDGPLSVGKFASLGPISLPLFAGLTASRHEARSFPLAGIENARVVLTAESNGLVALADFQKKALLGIFAIVLLGAAFILMLGAGAQAAAADSAAESRPAAAPAAAPVERAAPTPDQPLQVSTTGSSLFGDAPPPAPTVTPDDFPFGDAPQSPAPAPQQAAAPVETLAQAPAEPEPFAPPPEPEPVQAAPQYVEPSNDAIPMPAPAGYSPFDEAAAAPAAEQPFDPFAAAASMSDYPPDQEQESHEATVVAAIPQELLRAATRAPAPRPIATPIGVPAVSIPVPAPQVDPEEAHFQDIFNQFVATRSQCNEPADGLTYEKFVVKLRKNKEQLVQKYSCKSVRFQVYVKEGKAALKATPIKD